MHCNAAATPTGARLIHGLRSPPELLSSSRSCPGLLSLHGHPSVGHCLSCQGPGMGLPSWKNLGTSDYRFTPISLSVETRDSSQIARCLCRSRDAANLRHPCLSTAICLPHKTCPRRPSRKNVRPPDHWPPPTTSEVHLRIGSHARPHRRQRSSQKGADSYAALSPFTRSFLIGLIAAVHADSPRKSFRARIA